MNRKAPNTAIIITILVVMAICVVCVCLSVTLIGAGYISAIKETPGYFSPRSTATPLPWPTPMSTDAPNGYSKLLEGAYESLNTLNNSIVPENNPIDLAERLGGKVDVPDTLPDPDMPYEVGDQKQFWVTNTDTNKNTRVDATLRYLGDNIYFWIQNDVRYQDDDLQQLAHTFDTEIIPKNREFFGMEWNPGVDHDPRMYVLYARKLGMNVAGYFSSADELHPDAHPYSNAHEMFLLSADNVSLGEDYTYGTMAHEFQHMIHWYQDRNEETWVNEGFSMLAEHINELDAGGFDYDFMMNPDIQLTDWGGDIGQNAPHYGGSFLFMTYFLDQFGEETTKALVSHKENGFTAIGIVLEELQKIDPNTNQPFTAEQVFTDWTIANYLQDPTLEDGRYAYKSYNPFSLYPDITLETCPAKNTYDVHQFGTDYIEITCPGEYVLTFTGTPTVRLLPFQAPSSGKYFFWSNLGDESNPTLTQTFDFTQVQAPIELTFKTWYDLEEDYDYVFISATTDGKVWQILDSRNCTTDNPSGNSYGCGWNGLSGGWIDESVDLSQYAGTKVTLQFDYVTDAAVNGKGFVLDDFSIQAVGYQSDLESDSGGWEPQGFVRVQNLLPQEYSVSLISEGRQTKVEHLILDENGQAQVTVSIDDEVEKVVLVVSGVTPFTRERALYQVEIR